MIIYFTGIVNGAGPGSPFELIMGAAAPGRAYPAMLRPPPFSHPSAAAVRYPCRFPAFGALFHGRPPRLPP